MLQNPQRNLSQKPAEMLLYLKVTSHHFILLTSWIVDTLVFKFKDNPQVDHQSVLLFICSPDFSF